MAARRKAQSEFVAIHVLTAFGLSKPGDVAITSLTPVVQGWINLGLVEVVSDVEVTISGESTAGPGAVEPADPGSEPERAGDVGTSGDEPGEDASAG